jgi:hypothetical protein
MTIDQIHSEVVGLEREITEVAPGSAELGAVTARIRELQDELERARSVLGPLVPDASSPPSLAERTADDLGAALGNLLRAATAKQDASGV